MSRNELQQGVGLRRWIWVALLMLFNAGLPAVESEGVDYRYDFMWPQLEQPWYFNAPADVAVAPDGSVYVADTNNHRIQQFDATGIFIRTWGSEGDAEEQLNLPKGIAVGPDGTVYVADTGNHRIQLFSAVGAFLGIWGNEDSAEGQLFGPSGIAVAPDGSVYVTDENHRVQQFSTTGTFLHHWGSEGNVEGQFNQPSGIAVAPDGAVYVADTGNHRIQQFSAAGIFLRAWGSEGSGDRQFLGPTGVAAASDGTLFITDTLNDRIQQFSAEGVLQNTWLWSSNAVEQPHIPLGITVASDGTVYVADSGSDRIQHFSATGRSLAIWGSWSKVEGRFNQPKDIAVAPDGTLYVADTDNQRIQRFSATGAFINTWGRQGRGPGAFNYPEGITVAPDGLVYVADTGNHRIQQFSATGDFLSQWGTEGRAEGQFRSPSGVAVAPDGTLYVADTGNNRIQQFIAKDGFLVTGDFVEAGTLLNAWGSWGFGKGQFNFPRGIEVASDGTVYVADTGNRRIQTFNPRGEPLSRWSKTGDAEGQLNSPAGIAVSPAGSVYVTDKDRHTIHQYAPDGSPLGFWGGHGTGAGEFIQPQGIGVNSTGQIYVMDSGNDRIQAFRRAVRSVNTPKALIIVGRTAIGDTLDEQAQTLMIRQVYGALQAQGYRSDAGYDDLRVLWTGQPIQLGPDSLLHTEPATKAVLEALKPWASSAERLLVYLLGHGIKHAFYLNAIEGEQELLSSQELDAWLDVVQAGLTDDITLIVEACHAGSFLEPIKGEDRLVLTSAGAEERALFGYHGVNSYSYQFWSELSAGRDIKTAHENASKRLEGQSDQQPLIDANANAIGNERDDLALSRDRCIGIEVNEVGQLVRGCKGYLSPPPQIEQITEDQVLVDEQSAELWLTVDLLSIDSITDAWVMLTRPDRESETSQSFDLLPIITLQRDETEPGRWVGVYAPGVKNRQGELYQGFDVPGEYRLAYYVKSGDGLLSAPKHGVFTQAMGMDLVETVPAIFDSAAAQLNLPIVRVDASDHTATLILVNTLLNQFQLQSLALATATATDPPEWNPATGNVDIPQLITTENEQTYSGRLHLDDAEKWLFTLSVTPANP